jgi:uracil-DNA glycosylase
MTIEFDPGPPKKLAAHLAAVPSYAAHRDFFWYDWGPIFYRGRLNGKARLLAIASDPGPTERIAGRTLVGDAGQRVQGFLTKLGLTRSYVLVNAFAYALLPTHAQQALPILQEPQQRTWRNKLYDDITGPNLQAIVAFGAAAQKALELWDTKPNVPTFKVPHPSSRDPQKLVDEWRAAITQLRTIITPDTDGSTNGPNYGPAFLETDYAPIPARDLPFGLPAWFGNDHWGRTANPPHNNCVERPQTDRMHTITWTAPANTP